MSLKTDLSKKLISRDFPSKSISFNNKKKKEIEHDRKFLGLQIDIEIGFDFFFLLKNHIIVVL